MIEHELFGRTAARPAAGKVLRAGYVGYEARRHFEQRAGPVGRGAGHQRAWIEDVGTVGLEEPREMLLRGHALKVRACPEFPSTPVYPIGRNLV